MSQMINWICLVCITFLVVDIMVYFCKDAVDILNSGRKRKCKNITRTKVTVNEYMYETKIAK